MKKILLIVLSLILAIYVFINFFASKPHLANDLTHQQFYSQDSEFMKLEYLDSALDQILKIFDEKDNEQDLIYYLNYLKAYSYFGETPNEQAVEKANQILIRVSSESQKYIKNPDIQRLYLSNVHRWFALDTAINWNEHLNISQQLLTSQFQTQADEGNNHSLWENFITHGVIFKWLKSEADDSDKEQFIDKLKDYQQALLNLARQANKNEYWVKQHIFWLLSKLHNFIEDEAEQETFDNEVILIAQSYKDLEQHQLKQLITESYLIPSFRTKENCDEEQWQDFCLFTELDVALPTKHICSDDLFIRAQQMTDAQLQQSCKQLISQQQHFHQLFATEMQPVADDLNSSLRVAIFDNWTQYHRYSPMLFDINTDNGGMYIEGDPSSSVNQATFFTFEASWLRPEFKVWNLNHEYVHYLTGRFTTYGPYGHYPDHMVWWTEGIAEYIAKINDNSQANETLADTSIEDIPDLTTLFATSYSDSLNLVYRWSYWAIRYLAEKDVEQLIQLKGFLFNKQFDEYIKQLDEISTKHDVEFNNWLLQQKSNINEKTAELTKFPRRINRYAYPKYLTPDWLRNDGWYQHY